jgi:hypothetical protein
MTKGETRRHSVNVASVAGYRWSNTNSSVDLKINIRRSPHRQLAVLTVIINVVRGNSVITATTTRQSHITHLAAGRRNLAA